MIAKLRQAVMPIGVGLAGLVIYGLLQVTKPQPTPNIEAPRPVSVNVAPAIRAASRPTVVVYGEVRPAVRTQLVAQVGGRITSIAPDFIDGGQFASGDVLLNIINQTTIFALSFSTILGIDPTNVVSFFRKQDRRTTPCTLATDKGIPNLRNFSPKIDPESVGTFFRRSLPIKEQNTLS